uniref:Glutamine amidotransferase type-2 domain-containing protein n=1 Tax=Cyclopterus lumpus TaxID=8103 RepID=A0A8C2XQ85_CYCLU
MCGIFCLLSLSAARCAWSEAVHERLKRRGPDSSQDVTVGGTDAHILHMKGLLTPQPVQDHTGNVLVWNGEIFGGLPVMPEENDTAVVSQRLSSCDGPSEILSVLSTLCGPWAFVYHQKAGDYLWFGRDFLGRRSLLWTFDAEVNALTLTSVAARESGPTQSSWQEVPAVGVYRVDLKAVAEAGCVTFEICFPILKTTTLTVFTFFHDRRWF